MKIVTVYIKIGILLFLSIYAQAQEDRLTKKDGLLRATGAIEPGYLFKQNLLTTYVSGLLEYQLQERVSVRGDFAVYINMQENAYLLDNHGLYFGAAYHFTDKAIVDPYLGFQPGVQLTRVRYWNDTDLAFYQSKFKLVPVATLIGGVNFYVSRFFNFYVATRGVFGEFSGGGAPASVPLCEWRITFGLGFNIGLKK